MGAGGFSTNYREESLISKLENSRQSSWFRQMNQLNELADQLAQRLALKLVDENLVETSSMRDLEEQLAHCLGTLLDAEDYDIQFAISPIRNLVPRPNRISLYVTAYIIEKLISHRSVEDIFGTDEEIYEVVNNEVVRLIK